MDTHEKLSFIQKLVDGVKMRIIEKAKDMPEDWDGRELRWYIAEKFNGAVFDRNKKGKRYKEYRNTVITKGL